jgi:hypothetical protein
MVSPYPLFPFLFRAAIGAGCRSLWPVSTVHAIRASLLASATMTNPLNRRVGML